MNPKSALVGMVLVIIILSVVGSLIACGVMVQTKKGVGRPYVHPKKPGEFRPLGAITPLTKQEQEMRKNAVQKQITPK